MKFLISTKGESLAGLKVTDLMKDLGLGVFSASIISRGPQVRKSFFEIGDVVFNGDDIFWVGDQKFQIVSNKNVLYRQKVCT